MQKFKAHFINSENYRQYYPILWFSILFCLATMLLTACNLGGTGTPAATPNTSTPVTTNSGTVTYDSNPQNVIVRTFYGGGNLGTLEFSPEISIYGDGRYILGPGLQMRQGKLSSDALQNLLQLLVDSDGLLHLTRQQFYDVPDQNATFLELMLNNKHYEFLYGPFGGVQESTQDVGEYHQLGNALTSIRDALKGPLHPYTDKSTALLVHQTFSPNLSQNIPSWTFPDFTLFQAATFECGPTPIDETSTNGDTGCLTFTTPQHVVLLTASQQQSISSLLNGQQQAVFTENGLYYTLALRPLLPDELINKTLAMLGSQEFTYSGIPLHNGPIPYPTVTPQT